MYRRIFNFSVVHFEFCGNTTILYLPNQNRPPLCRKFSTIVEGHPFKFFHLLSRFSNSDSLLPCVATTYFYDNGYVWCVVCYSPHSHNSMSLKRITKTLRQTIPIRATVSTSDEYFFICCLFSIFFLPNLH